MKRLASYLMLSIALHAGVGWLLHAFRVKPQALAWQVPITIQLVSLAQAAPPLATEPVRPASQPVATSALAEPAVKPAAKATPPKAVTPHSQPAIVKSVPPARSKPLGEPRPARSESAPAPPPSRPTAIGKSAPAPASTVASPAPLAPVVSLRPSFVSPPPPPRYPSQARRRNQQGIVRVEVSLDERGNQLKLTLVRSSGIESLDQAALEAVTKWRFRPEVVDGRTVPSRVEILPALGELGYIMALTRNEHCVHERKGVYQEVSIMGSGQMGMVLSPDIDLRLFLSGWASVFAVDETTARGPQRSIQVFDRQGTAVHKVFLTDTSEVSAWAPLVERYRADEQSSELDLQPLPAAKAARTDAEVDAETLRSEWSQLQDTHDFFGLLKRNDVVRTQALRLAGAQWAEPLATVELTNLIEEAGRREVPIMVFVGNKHCIQIHSGPVTNLRWMDTWFNVLDPAFNLHLKTTGVTELWRVRKPSVDGIVTSYEGFDADGELVIQLFGVRKPGVPERDDWRTLAELATPMTA